MKVQVNISNELVRQIDKYAEMMGISRSSLCATFIGQGIMTYNKSFEIIGSMGEKIGDGLLVEKTLKEMGDSEKK